MVAAPPEHAQDRTHHAQVPDTLQAILASSGPDSREWEEMQFDIGEGPSRTAFVTRRPVLVPDLTLSLGRWPGYAPAAIGTQLGAAYALPLQCGAVRFGVLTCYNRAPRTLSGGELSSILTIADRATHLLLDAATDDPAKGGWDELQGATTGTDRGLFDAMDLRSEIYQAQGMVMAQLDVSLTEALRCARR